MIRSSACPQWQPDQPGSCRSSWWPRASYTTSGATTFGDRRLEHACNREKPPGRDPIRALLVFLNLLEGDAEARRERLLGHADLPAPLEHLVADEAVDR